MKTLLICFFSLSTNIAASISPIIRDTSIDTPEKARVAIAATSYSGSGCPKGSVSSILSDDRTVVTFGFDKFQALIGPKAKSSDSSKNCEIKLGLSYPSEFQLSIVRATYHGYIRLDDGVTAKFLSNYFWSGQPQIKVRLEHRQRVWFWNWTSVLQSSIFTVQLF
jgi:Domain of unknown function (DUF4360)